MREQTLANNSERAGKGEKNDFHPCWRLPDKHCRNEGQQRCEQRKVKHDGNSFFGSTEKLDRQDDASAENCAAKCHDKPRVEASTKRFGDQQDATKPEDRNDPALGSNDLIQEQGSDNDHDHWTRKLNGYSVSQGEVYEGEEETKVAHKPDEPARRVQMNFRRFYDLRAHAPDERCNDNKSSQKADEEDFEGGQRLAEMFDE